MVFYTLPADLGVQYRRKYPPTPTNGNHLSLESLLAAIAQCDGDSKIYRNHALFWELMKPLNKGYSMYYKDDAIGIIEAEQIVFFRSKYVRQWAANTDMSAEAYRLLDLCTTRSGWTLVTYGSHEYAARSMEEDAAVLIRDITNGAVLDYAYRQEKLGHKAGQLFNSEIPVVALRTPPSSSAFQAVEPRPTTMTTEGLDMDSAIKMLDQIQHQKQALQAQEVRHALLS